MKKIVSIFLTTAACAGLSVFPVSADNPARAEGESGMATVNNGVADIASSAPKYEFLPSATVKNYDGNMNRPVVGDGFSSLILGQENKNVLIRKKYIEPLSSASSMDPAKMYYNATVTYYDGLGYVEQEIESQGSPMYNDIITPFKHDFLGRQDVWTYLPYTEKSTSFNGAYRDSAITSVEQWYEDFLSGVEPFTYRKYERSVAGRAIARYLPGYMNSLCEKYLYDTSSETDKVLSIRPGVTQGTFEIDAAYEADGSLFKTTVTDEEGHNSVTFTDGSGKKILFRQSDRSADGNIVFMDTYFVYDAFDRLVCVISPEGSRRLVRGSVCDTADERLFSAFAYYYSYDSKGRLAEEWTSERGWEYFVYDRNNRLALRQDGNMHQSSVHNWLRFEYDAFGRLTTQSILSNPKPASGGFYTRSDWQQRFDNDQTSLPEGVTALTTIQNSYDKQLCLIKEASREVNVRKDCLLAIRVASNNAVWDVASLDTQHIFFDEKGVIREEYWLGDIGKPYAEPPHMYYYIPVDFYPQLLEICQRLKPMLWSMVTNSTFVAQLRLPGCISGKVQLYDRTGYMYLSTKLAFAPVKNVVSIDDVDSRNKGLKTAERLAYIDKTGVTSKFMERNFYYDAKGRIVQIVEDNGADGYTRYSRKYNHRGKVLTYLEQHYSIYGSSLSSKTVRYVYDHRGRLVTETTDLNGVIGTVEFSYNELGQLVSRQASGTGNDAITQTYQYNIRGHMTQTGVNGYFTESILMMPTGKIRETWTNFHDQGEMRNVFSYDGLGRLTYAKMNHYAGNAETFASYDANGNVTMLKESLLMLNSPNPKGRTQTYRYAGNVLMEMNKEIFPQTHLSGICSFMYDNNGNMTFNGNKLLQLRYNYLNLICEAKNADGTGVQYTWLADGEKVKAELATPSSQGSSYLYRGSLAYDLSTGEKSTAFSGGKLLARPSAGTGSTSLIHITDHLGSVRIAVAGEFVMDNEYEPFGELAVRRSMSYGTGLINTTLHNRWQFNGKEKQITGATGLLDYGARMYDPELARWMSPDPLAAANYSVSPYAFCSGDPINRRDIDGRLDDWYFDINGAYLGQDDGASDYIRIMDRSQWEVLAADGTVDHAIGKLSAVLFSSAPMTDANALKVYNHFNDTGEELFIYKGSDKGNMHASIKYSKDANEVPIKVTRTSIGVSVPYNRKEKTFDTSYNIISGFEHESEHIRDARENIKAYVKKERPEKEDRALRYQIQSPTFKKTTRAFRQGVFEYARQMGVNLDFLK